MISSLTPLQASEPSSPSGQRPQPPEHSSGKRIALVLYGFSGGGMERSMLRLASGLQARGHAVEFVVKWRRGRACRSSAGWNSGL